MMRAAPDFAPRLRVSRGSRHLFGPGKADLLRHIATAGSVRQAAAAMRMSYQRAWSLVQQMNAEFVRPLVTLSRGGGRGGGAVLTPAGRRVLALYSRMDRASRAATRADWTALRGLLR
jgi:molybdate transport system regulatory protein